MTFLRLLENFVQSGRINENLNLIQEFGDALPLAIYIRELKNHNFIFINDKFQQIVGYTKEELLGNNLFMQTSTQVSYNENLIKQLKDRSEKFQKVTIKDKKGNLIPLIHSFKLITENEGNAYSIGVLISASTSEERKTISIFSNNIDMEVFLELVRIPIAIINRKVGNITFLNSAMEQYLKMTESKDKLSLINKICFGNEVFTNNYKLFLNEKLQFYEYFASFEDVDHHVKSSLCILNNLSDLNSDLLIIYPVVSENPNLLYPTKVKPISEIETELVRSNFITLVSHEFRTPLTKILLATDLLMNYDEKMRKEEKIEKFNEIKDTIYGMTKLMEAILTISRMEQNLFQPEFEFIDVRAFFETILDSFIIRNNKNIHYEYTLSTISKLVPIEMTLMTLIANNIIDNATKFSHPNSTVEVNVAIGEDEKIIMEVKDYGIGIPEFEVEFVFNSFYKASNNRHNEGYGLGLYIVKKCIEILNGDIFIESKLNHGTTVKVVIPLQHQTK